MRFKRLIISVLTVFLLFSCRKPTTANWDTDVVIPVVTSNLNIKNFLGDTIFKADNTGLLHLIYNREVAAFKLDSLLKLPDTVVTSPFINIFETTLNPGQSITGLPATETVFNIGNGAKLKRADIRKAVLTVKFTNRASQPIDIFYKISSAKKNGLVFTLSETVPVGVNSLVKNYDLAGYSLDLTGLGGNKSNTISQAYTVSINPNSGPTTVPSGEAAKLEVSYSEIVPQYVEGYFGTQVVDLPKDSIKINLKDNFKAVNFLLNEATMNFKLLNEFGADFSASIINIKAINTFDNKVVTLSNSRLTNLNVNSATRSGNTIYPDSQFVLFNKSNSNIAEFISCLPNRLTFTGQVSLNPLGFLSHSNFAYYNTGLRIIADVDIPMKYKADYFRLRTNATVNFENLSQLDNVNSGNFVITATNAFPFDARLQAYLLDKNNVIIDSLFVPGTNVIGKADLNANNLVQTNRASIIKVPLTQPKIANLKKCKTIQVWSYFVMPANGKDVFIRENSELKVGIVAEINYNVGIKSR